MEQQSTVAKIVVHALYAFKAQNTDEVKHGFVDERSDVLRPVSWASLGQHTPITAVRERLKAINLARMLSFLLRLSVMVVASSIER